MDNNTSEREEVKLENNDREQVEQPVEVDKTD